MKIKTKLKACFVCILSVATGIYAGNAANSGVYADVTANPNPITFTATVSESLSVTLTQSLTASGTVNNLLTNSFAIAVSTNNTTGYTASMHSASNTNLVHTTDNTYTIPTLTAGSTAAAANFPTNRWGYSVDSGANYKPMSTSSVWIGNGTSAGGSHTVYFGAKVDTSKKTGSYTNSVVVNVVSGVSTGSGTTPSVPASPAPNTPSQDTNQTDKKATYVSSTDTSVYVNPSNTNQTQIISGNYTGPLGATESTYYTSSNVSGGSSLATGLAVASATAAVSGGLFYALAKFRGGHGDFDE